MANIASSSTEKYDGWTREQLIERLNRLDPPIPQRRRYPDTFSFTSYARRKIALKFCYSGSEYSGLAFQKDPTPLPTVEGVLFDALAKSRLIEKDAGFEGCSWERCGRTDRGVSAGGQVASLWVRSALPPKALEEAKVPKSKLSESSSSIHDVATISSEEGELELDELEDGFGALDISESSVNTSIPKPRPGKEPLEHDYVRILNNLLPPTIRVLAWSPVLESFSARFSCKRRHYKYFFSPKGLDISRMEEAASRLIGEHDFRNLCKVDPTKQITRFQRRILEAYIEPLFEGEDSLYVFNLVGSAFLYHQVRHIMAILFLVGSGLEPPSLVTTLMNVSQGAESPVDGDRPYEVLNQRPLYEMADGLPLMLWDCVYDDNDVTWRTGVKRNPETRSFTDLYADMEAIHEQSLIHAALTKHFLIAASQHHSPPLEIFPIPKEDLPRIKYVLGNKVIHVPLGAGTFKRRKYMPLLERNRLEPVEVINERWRVKKGLPERLAEADEEEDE